MNPSHARPVVDRGMDDATRRRVRERFEQHLRSDGAHFPRPMRVNLLRKRG